MYQDVVDRIVAALSISGLLEHWHAGVVQYCMLLLAPEILPPSYNNRTNSEPLPSGEWTTCNRVKMVLLIRQENKKRPVHVGNPRDNDLPHVQRFVRRRGAQETLCKFLEALTALHHHLQCRTYLKARNVDLVSMPRRILHVQSWHHEVYYVIP